MVATPTRQDCAVSGATLTDAIRESGTAKEVAHVGRCSEATAARWRRGETMPNPVSLARLMGWSSNVANAMLRLAGLDDLSMDLEEARLKRRLAELQAQRAGADETTDAAPGAAASPLVGTRSYLAKTTEALSDHALHRAARALENAKR
jgi:hypothetical protein